MISCTERDRESKTAPVVRKLAADALMLKRREELARKFIASGVST